MGRKKHGVNNELDELIREVLLPLESRSDIISPVYIANEVDKRADPENLAPALKSYGFIQYVRGRARAIIAERHDPARDERDDQMPLFKGLQPFYPQAVGSDYVRREIMTSEDYLYNIDRMRAEVRSKSAHADALEAEYNEKVAAGVLVA